MDPSLGWIDIETILELMAPAGRYWTLHGGGAAVFHLRHRLVNELDFFLEPGTWDREGMACTMEPLAALVPLTGLTAIAERLEKVAETALPADGVGVVKVNFQKVIFSFVFKPLSRGTQKRVLRPSRLPVASAADVLGIKMQVLFHRDSLHDYFDVASGLERGYPLSFMLDGFCRMTVIQKIDFPLLFSKLIQPPDVVVGGLSEAHRHLLRQAGQEGQAAFQRGEI